MALLATVWFASAGWRTGRAQAFDVAARAAFVRSDLDTAYQQERFAYAIAPDSDRALSLGALAYLRGEYERSGRHFAQGAGDLARLGETAAAAKSGNGYDAARDRAGIPSDHALRIGLAYAALHAADFGTVGRLLEDEPAGDITTDYPSAVARSVEDPRRSVRMIRTSEEVPVTVSHPDPAVAGFLTRLTAIPDDAVPEALDVFDRMAGVSGETSRRVLQGSLLYDLGNPRAALRIARTASEAEPEYRDAWNLRAAAAAALGERREAAQAVDISTELDPSWGYSWYLKSELAKAAGDTDGAAEFRHRAELLGYTK